MSVYDAATSCACCYTVVCTLLYHQVGWRDEGRRVELQRTFKTEAAFILARYLSADPRRHPDALLTAQGLLLEVIRDLPQDQGAQSAAVVAKLNELRH